MLIFNIELGKFNNLKRLGRTTRTVGSPKLKQHAVTSYIVYPVQTTMIGCIHFYSVKTTLLNVGFDTLISL
jgi:hypothetical protein